MLPLATARWLLGRTCILPPGRLAGGTWLSTASPVRWGLVTGRRCIVGGRESLGVPFSLFSGYEKMLAGVQGQAGAGWVLWGRAAPELEGSKLEVQHGLPPPLLWVLGCPG